MLKLLGQTWLWLTGWRLAGPVPADPKFVLIAYPHTSNWDYVYMMAAAAVYGVRVHWLGKAELFDSPLGWLYRRTGGIPVDRGRSTNMVETAARWFAEHERFILVVPPSGTRAYRDYWKSGFYYIALAAGVPINLAVMDFAKRVTGFGPSYLPTGNVKADMDFIRAHYADTTGRNPERQQRIRLRAEDEGEGAGQID